VNKNIFFGPLGMLLFIGIPLIKSFFELSKRQKIQGQKIDLIESNHEPIILLRSFEMDKIGTTLQSFKLNISLSSLDEKMYEGVPSEIPMLSFGNPNDFLPTPGSIKLQVYDEHWKTVVEKLFLYARAVVVIEGLSNSLEWEISRITTCIDPKKFFIITPDKKIRKQYAKKIKKKNIWQHFSAILSKNGIKVDETDPGPNALISFDNEWKGMVCYQGTPISNMGFVLGKTSEYDNKKFNYTVLYQECGTMMLSTSIKNEWKWNHFLKISSISVVLFLLMFIVLFVIMIYYPNSIYLLSPLSILLTRI